MHILCNFIFLIIFLSLNVFFITFTQLGAIDLIKYKKAFQDKLLNNFAVKVIGWSIELLGVLKLIRGEIIFKVLNGLEQINQVPLIDQLLNIIFIHNGTSFQLQHNALDWMVKHDLFNQLIENEVYLKSQHEEETR